MTTANSVKTVIDEFSVESDGGEVRFIVRPSSEADKHLVLNSWLKSYRAHAAFGVPNDIYYSFHHAIVSRLFEDHATLVVCPEANPELIVGWACYSVIDKGPVIHYMYVKHDCRGSGIASKMYDTIVDMEGGGFVQHTHATPAGKRLAKSLGSTYNPYLLFTLMPPEWYKR